MLRIVFVTLITVNLTLILSLIQVLILYLGGLKAIHLKLKCRINVRLMMD